MFDRDGRKATMRHAVIMAGGAGTRLWPLSRKLRPKQLLRLFDGQSLIQISRQRLQGIFEPENTWIITSQHYLDQVATELPDLPRENLIGEPMGRDTSNAIGLAAELLQARDPDATMAVFTADHIITPQDTFASAIRAGLDAAEANPTALTTFGIKPASPHTGYGYVRRGQQLTDQTYQVAEFKEKPTQVVAEQYVASGEYYWNSGMFAWKTSTVLSEMQRLMPKNAAALHALATDWARIAGTDECAQRFSELEKISIDFGVMEKAEQVLVVEMACNWLDLGSWTAIGSTAEPDPAGNEVLAPRAIALDADNNILVSEDDHLIVTLGVQDVVVVHSGDATLVCHKDQVQRIKELAEQRQARFGDQYE
jgi:mannose-1-phosphate guanylyltransferase